MKERLARASDRLFDRLRARAAFTVTEDTAVDGDLDSVRGSTYALLVTFRRNGDPLPTPVWCAVDDAGIAYVKTARHAGKLKRLRNDDRALLAPATARGKPTGSAIRVR
ncbi:MAG: hypothetical protein QOD30_1069, partial [Actinomycetota bacterium]|nr:hypothetical protein [Actinomycetota bacterium]